MLHLCIGQIRIIPSGLVYFHILNFRVECSGIWFIHCFSILPLKYCFSIICIVVYFHILKWKANCCIVCEAIFDLDSSWLKFCELIILLVVFRGRRNCLPSILQSSIMKMVNSRTVKMKKCVLLFTMILLIARGILMKIKSGNLSFSETYIC